MLTFHYQNKKRLDSESFDRQCLNRVDLKLVEIGSVRQTIDVPTKGLAFQLTSPIDLLGVVKCKSSYAGATCSLIP